MDQQDEVIISMTERLIDVTTIFHFSLFETLLEKRAEPICIVDVHLQ